MSRWSRRSRSTSRSTATVTSSRRRASRRAGATGSKKSAAASKRMKLYPEDALWDEIAYLAYHLHWDFDQLLDLAHQDRARLDPLGRRSERTRVGGGATCPMTTVRQPIASPPRRSSFEVDGVEIGRFMEVSADSRSTVAVEDVEEGGENSYVHKLPGRMTWPNITLKRGITQNDTSADVAEQVVRRAVRRQRQQAHALDGGDHPHGPGWHSGCVRGVQRCLPGPVEGA